MYGFRVVAQPPGARARRTPKIPGRQVPGRGDDEARAHGARRRRERARRDERRRGARRRRRERIRRRRRSGGVSRNGVVVRQRRAVHRGSRGGSQGQRVRIRSRQTSERAEAHAGTGRVRRRGVVRVRPAPFAVQAGAARGIGARSTGDGERQGARQVVRVGRRHRVAGRQGRRGCEGCKGCDEAAAARGGCHRATRGLRRG